MPDPVERAPDLARILGDTPAAAMLVDLRRGEVVSADHLSREMAPGLALPSRVEQWSSAARLRDADGLELTDVADPLRQLVRGEPVTGQAVSVVRATDGRAGRELRWLVALPLGDAPGLGAMGLVMLFSVRPEVVDTDGAAPGDPALTALTPGSVLLDGLSYTVADARAPDAPLVWVSPGFTDVTGYRPDEVLGRNCRFLQGRHSSADAVGRLRAAIDGRSAAVETLLNHTRDGRPFWNQVTLNPVFDAAGVMTHLVGVQNDVSDRRSADRARDLAVSTARSAEDRAARFEARLEALTGAAYSYSTAVSEVQLAARYVPAGETLGTGGDFFDVHELTDRRVSVAVGDILGHDVRPTAAITQVQGMITALAAGGDLGPAAILERVDVVASTSEDDSATVWVGELTREDQDWRLRSSSAGHPPIVLRHPGGEVDVRSGAVGEGLEPPLGLGHGARTDSVVELAHGTTLVAFSDGLVRRRGEQIDVGLGRLRDAVADGPANAVELCDHLVERLISPGDAPPEDDVVVLVIGLTGLLGSVDPGPSSLARPVDEAGAEEVRRPAVDPAPGPRRRRWGRRWGRRPR